MSVDRFEPHSRGSVCFNSFGWLVRYDDYKKLQAENARLIEKIPTGMATPDSEIVANWNDEMGTLRRENKALEDEIEKIQTENLRLRNRVEDILETLETWIDSEGSQGKGEIEYNDLVWVITNAKAQKEKEN